jgi:hypothetical protein
MRPSSKNIFMACARRWEAEHAEGGLVARYMPAEMAADVRRSGHRVLATVFVDCGFSYRPAGTPRGSAGTGADLLAASRDPLGPLGNRYTKFL